MDVVITTSDPENVTEHDVRAALEGADFYVDRITIITRAA